MKGYARVNTIALNIPMPLPLHCPITDNISDLAKCSAVLCAFVNLWFNYASPLPTPPPPPHLFICVVVVDDHHHNNITYLSILLCPPSIHPVHRQNVRYSGCGIRVYSLSLGGLCCCCSTGHMDRLWLTLPGQKTIILIHPSPCLMQKSIIELFRWL